MASLRAPGPRRLALITALVLLNDAATTVGWWQAMVHRRWHR
jgi:hypothetical protein